ncbi:MAG: ATP-binding protein [Thermomicrobiales bacterium]
MIARQDACESLELEKEATVRDHSLPPCLYLFTGISFAGKSVLACQLVEHLGVPRVDPDEVSHRLGLGLAGEFLSDAQWARIHTMAEEAACAHLRAGVSVVYDTTAFTRRQRDALRDLAQSCGATTQLIFVDTPRELAYQRWLANERTRERPRVHPDDFTMVADRFEPPGRDEYALRFTPEDDVNAWIAARIDSA